MENNEINEEKQSRKEITIIINAKKHKVLGPKITFEDVVKLAFGPISTNPNIVYTVIYKNGPRQNPDGTMDKGASVHIREGMIFHATQTDRS